MNIEKLKSAAEAGSIDAQYELSCLYYAGNGVPQSYQEAVKWARMAAERGDAHSQFCLGSAYVSGDGIAKDEKLACQWFGKAALQGHIEAARALDQLSQYGWRTAVVFWIALLVPAYLGLRQLSFTPWIWLSIIALLPLAASLMTPRRNQMLYAGFQLSIFCLIMLAIANLF